MNAKEVLGIVTGTAIIGLASISFAANGAAVLGSGSTTGMLVLLGVGLTGFGMWGRNMIRRSRRRNLEGQGASP